MVFEGAFQNIVDYTAEDGAYYRLEVIYLGMKNETWITCPNPSNPNYPYDSYVVPSCYAVLEVQPFFTLDKREPGKSWETVGEFREEFILWRSADHPVTPTGTRATNIGLRRSDQFGVEPAFKVGYESYYDFAYYVVDAVFGAPCDSATWNKTRILETDMIQNLSSLVIDGSTYKAIGATTQDSIADPSAVARIKLLLRKTS